MAYLLGQFSCQKMGTCMFYLKILKDWGYARILNFDILSLYRFSQLKPGDEFKLKLFLLKMLMKD